MKRFLLLITLITLCVSFSGCNAYITYTEESGNGVPRFLGRMVIKINDDGMSPTFSAGDKLIFKEVSDASSLKVSDIIAYWTVMDGQRVITVARIHEIYAEDDFFLFSTTYDNYDSVNPLTVHESEIIGKYKRKAILGLF